MASDITSVLETISEVNATYIAESRALATMHREQVSGLIDGVTIDDLLSLVTPEHIDAYSMQVQIAGNNNGGEFRPASVVFEVNGGHYSLAFWQNETYLYSNQLTKFFKGGGRDFTIQTITGPPAIIAYDAVTGRINTRLAELRQPR